MYLTNCCHLPIEFFSHPTKYLTLNCHQVNSKHLCHAISHHTIVHRILSLNLDMYFVHPPKRIYHNHFFYRFRTHPHSIFRPSTNTNLFHACCYLTNLPRISRIIRFQYSSVRPSIYSMSVYFIVLPVTDIHRLIHPDILTLSLFTTLRVVALISRTIRPNCNEDQYHLSHP